MGKKTWVKNLTAQQVDNMMSRPFFGGGKKNLEDIIPTARYELLDVWRSSAKAMLLGDRIRLGRPPPPVFSVSDLDGFSGLCKIRSERLCATSFFFQ